MSDVDETIAYIDNGLTNEDDSCELQVKYGEDGQLYLQQGQFLVPTDGQIVMLQNEAGDLNQYVIKSNVDDFEEENEFNQTHEPLICISTEECEGDILQMDDVQEPLIINEEIEEPNVDLTAHSEDGAAHNIEILEENCGDVNFVIPDDIDVSDQFQYQYAILKDGKLQLQTINIAQDDPNASEYVQASENNKSTIQEQLAIFQQSINLDESLTNKDAVDLDKITGKNLITGQTVTLDKYFNKLKQRITNSQSTNSKKQLNSFVHKINDKKNNSNSTSPNKKVVVGITKEGKKIYGQILQIFQGEKNEPKSVEKQPQIVLKKYTLTKENFDDIIRKTLSGLMELESIQRKLESTNLEVKVVEKAFDSGTGGFNKSVSFVYGYMELVGDEDSGNKWKFVVHEDANQIPNVTDNDALSQENKQNCPCYRKLTSFTLQRTTDRYGGTTTRVNLNEQNTFLHCVLCNGELKSSLQDKTGKSHEEVVNELLSNKSSDTKKQQRKLLSEQKWYRCSKCLKTFSTAGSLKRHVTVHDPSLRPLECSSCLQRFTDESSLRKHLLIHTGIRAYECDVCSRTFVNQGDLNFHKRTHNPIKQFRCSVCGQEFSRFSNLNRHLEIHRGTSAMHQCHICGCSYSFISTLTRHMVQKHLGEQIK